MDIKGIKFKIHYSWYIVAVLLTYGLWRSYFPSVSPGKSPLNHLLTGLTATLVLFGSVVMHELAHSVVAWMRGIKTESITLYFFGGVAELKREAYDAISDLYISLAGPTMSFILALFFKLLSVSPLDNYLYSMNLMIGMFNLLPAFPLDGGRVLRAIFWKLRDKGFVDAMRLSIDTGRYVIYVAVAVCVIWFVLKGEGLMMVFILGMVQFVANLYGKDLHAVSGKAIPIRDVCIKKDRMVCISLNDTVKDFYEKYFIVYGFHGYPVVDDGSNIVGMVTYWFIKKQEDIVPDTKIGSIYDPLDSDMLIRENATLEQALEKMYLCKRERLLVTSNNKEVTGLITKSVITRLGEIAEIKL